MAADHVVVERTGFTQRHADELALGLLGRLADGLGNFARLAVAETDPALLVADDDQCRKAEALAALDHVGHTVDVDQAIDEFAFALLNVSHCLFLCAIRTKGRLRGQRPPGPSRGRGRGSRRGRR